MSRGRVTKVNARKISWMIIGSLPFFALVPGAVAGLIPYWLTGWQVKAPFLGFQSLRFAGGFLVIAGLISLLESFLRFAFVGLGTPAPIAPPTNLVVSGQYRHVRNPMYVAMIAIVVGQCLILGSAALLSYAAVLWLIFHVWVTAYEEPKLLSQFGESYEVYRRNVRRWLPRVGPWLA